MIERGKELNGAKLGSLGVFLTTAKRLAFPMVVSFARPGDFPFGARARHLARGWAVAREQKSKRGFAHSKKLGKMHGLVRTQHPRLLISRSSDSRV